MSRSSAGGPSRVGCCGLVMVCVLKRPLSASVLTSLSRCGRRTTQFPAGRSQARRVGIHNQQSYPRLLISTES
jgi:hypothetical protein